MNPANPVKKLSQWTFTHQSAGGTPTTNLRTMAAKSECDKVGEHEKSNRIHGPALLVGKVVHLKAIAAECGTISPLCLREITQYQHSFNGCDFGILLGDHPNRWCCLHQYSLVV